MNNILLNAYLYNRNYVTLDEIIQLIKQKKILITDDICNLIFTDAAENGNLEIVKFLVENGISVHVNGYEAKDAAAYNDHLEVFKFLYENGAGIVEHNNHILQSSARHGNLKIIKYLFEIGVDMSVYNNNALNFAVQYNHLEVITFLYNNSKDFDDNLIFLINNIYKLNFDYNVNLINKIDVLLFALKLDKYIYFNEDVDIYDFIFNSGCQYHTHLQEFRDFINNTKPLKNKYISLKSILENKWLDYQY